MTTDTQEARMGTLDLDLWGYPEVADFLDIEVSTARKYVSSGFMPAPDKVVSRTPMWLPATIKNWHRARPFRGDRG